MSKTERLSKKGWNFAPVPGEVILSAELSMTDKVVYAYLLYRAGNKNLCWPGVDMVAKELNISESTVKRAIANLIRNNWIRRERHIDANTTTWVFETQAGCLAYDAEQPSRSEVMDDPSEVTDDLSGEVTDDLSERPPLTSLNESHINENHINNNKNFSNDPLENSDPPPSLPAEEEGNPPGYDEWFRSLTTHGEDVAKMDAARRAARNGGNGNGQHTSDERREAYFSASVHSHERGGEARSAIEKVFRLTPDWEAKSTKAAMRHLLSLLPQEVSEIRPACERFMRWWSENDWRGQKGQYPTLQQVCENWTRVEDEAPKSFGDLLNDDGSIYL